MKSALLMLTLAVAALTANAQTARFAGGTLVIRDGKKRVRIADVSDSPSETPLAPKVHFTKKLNGEYFVIVTTSEYTHGYPPRGGSCGGGTEAYISWLRIVDGKIIDDTRQRYASCAENRVGKIHGWHGSIFTVSGSDNMDGAAPDAVPRPAITFTFDARHPERGVKRDSGTPHAEPSPAG